MSWKRRIYALPAMRIYREIRLSRIDPQVAATDYGFPFAGNETYLRADWEAEEKAAIQSLLPEVDAFIDVGANHGFYSCLAAHAGLPAAAVEPERLNLQFLKANAVANGFEVFPLAASDAPGVLALYGDGDTASLVPGWFGVNFSQSVVANSLDNLFSDRWPGKRLLVKIDVEGAEAAVLKGARRLLMREPRPIWLVESFAQILDRSRKQSPQAEVFAMFDRAGYARSAVGPRSNFLFRAAG